MLLTCEGAASPAADHPCIDGTIEFTKLIASSQAGR
jgi:hypothetical protein